jgi:hypothetical protein
MDKAKCRGMDPNLFVPPFDPTTRQGPPPETLAVCNGSTTRLHNDPPCPVKAECFAYGKQYRCTGCWGGKALYLGRVRRAKTGD